MDIDKDGVINKNDLRAAFDNVGRLVMDEELNSMLSEVGGPCNYDNMIKMFAAKMAGGVNDPDDLVVGAFKAFDAPTTRSSGSLTPPAILAANILIMLS